MPPNNQAPKAATYAAWHRCHSRNRFLPLDHTLLRMRGNNCFLVMVITQLQDALKVGWSIFHYNHKTHLQNMEACLFGHV